MMFLAGLWHSLKVISIALYWLLSVCFIWAGFAQMGTSPSWGWACIACVLTLFVARGLTARRIDSGLSYVLACAGFGLFMALAWSLTGYRG